MKKMDYGELEAMVRDLQARVARGITVEQELIKTQNELDAELRRFRLMQEYSSKALKTADLQAFGELTVEYFVRIFDLPKVIFIDQNEEGKAYILAKFEIDQTDDDLIEMLDSELVPNNRKGEIYRKGDGSSFPHEKLAWSESIVSSICDQRDQCIGLIIAGIHQEGKIYYGKIEEKIADSFTVMTQKVGDYLQILRVNEHLKLGIAEATRELEEQALELKRSNRDLEHFAYVASHDLKAPLRNIASFVQLLNRKYKDQFDEEGKEYMQFVLGGVHRLNNLIKDLLQYARVNRVDLSVEHIDLHEIFEFTIHNLRDAIEKQGAQVKSVFCRTFAPTTPRWHSWCKIW